MDIVYLLELTPAFHTQIGISMVFYPACFLYLSLYRKYDLNHRLQKKNKNSYVYNLYVKPSNYENEVEFGY